MQKVSTFRLLIWPHRWLLFGPAMEAELHRHHLAQLAVGLDGNVAFKTSTDDHWRWVGAFYAPPDVPHALCADASRVALLYMDPEGSECWQACERFAQRTVSSIPARTALQAQSAQRLANPEISLGQAETAVRAILGHSPETRPKRDPRVQAAVQWLDSHLHSDIRLDALANAAGTSESWMTHNFRRIVGLPVRRYVLWRRLGLAVEAALAGATLTDAAHHAGFADSAHLSRTFKENFGIKPSHLFAAGVEVEWAEATAEDFKADAPGLGRLMPEDTMAQN